MSEALVISSPWILFAGSHMALSSVRLRPRLVVNGWFHGPLFGP